MSHLFARLSGGGCIGGLSLKGKFGNDDELLSAMKRVRGIAARVAAKTDVDPSLVSRVIHGERNSPAIISALREELSLIRDALNKAIADE